MQKRWLSGILAAIAATPLVQASLGGRIQGLFQTMVEIGSLNFLGVPNGSMIVMFVRVLIGILVFTILFALSSFMGTKNMPWMKRNHAVVVSACIALITMIFLPVQVLLAAGGGFGVAVGMGLVAAPIVAIVVMIMKLPGETGVDDRTSIFLKLLLCCILFWVLTAMSYHVGYVL
tara:strand:+ start:6510 stop:7034 length:525 start_codon:yes stop_codon:yes gene_type:complete